MSTDKKSGFDSLQRLSHVEVLADEKRVATGIAGLDQCLSASDEETPGIPLGTSILLSGMPGGGKSTMATMMIGASSGECLYLHGEEKARNVKKRHERVSPKGPNAVVSDPWLSPLREAEKALDDIRNLSACGDLERVVVDSIQMLTLGGKRKYDHQYEAVEMLSGQICSGNGIAIFVSHVSKSGSDHAGAAALAHLVDIHLHVTTNAKKAERVLEVRKNRHGRAGFQVPINIGPASLSVGVPAPISNQEGMGAARNALERCRDKAIELLMDGKHLNFYDFIEAGVSGNMWRAGLEMAVKTLTRDGHEMGQEKIKARMTFWMINPPPKVDGEVVVSSGSKIEVVNAMPIELT